MYFTQKVHLNEHVSVFLYSLHIADKVIFIFPLTAQQKKNKFFGGKIWKYNNTKYTKYALLFEWKIVNLQLNKIKIKWNEKLSKMKKVVGILEARAHPNGIHFKLSDSKIILLPPFINDWKGTSYISNCTEKWRERNNSKFFFCIINYLLFAKIFLSFYI